MFRERSYTHQDNANAYSSVPIQKDSSWRECIYQENDLFFDANSYGRECLVQFLYLSTTHPNHLHLQFSVLPSLTLKQLIQQWGIEYLIY